MHDLLKTTLPRAGVCVLLAAMLHGVLPAEEKTKAEDTSSAKTFTILTWNLEHFTDPFDSPYIDNWMEDAGSTKSEDSLERLAYALKTIHPDVICVQETEGDRALKFYLDEYLPGNDYKFYASVPAEDWYQNCVVASRFPLGPITSLREVESYNDVSKEKKNTYNNRLMYVEVQPTTDYSFIVANLHLKSGRDPEDTVWREDQMKLVKESLKKEFPDVEKANIVIVGDMNSAPDTDEYKALRTAVFPMVDPMEPLSHPATQPSRAPRAQIDHILFTDGMAKEYVPDSAGVATPLSLDEMATISDHLPVVASFYAEDK